MKKIFVFFALLMLMTVVAHARSEGGEDVNVGIQPVNEVENEDSNDDSTDDSVDSVEEETEIEFREEHSTVRGLENAILRVKKNETAEHLEEVLRKIEEKRLEQLNKLNETHVEEIDGEVEIHGKGPVKLLGLISTQYEYQYKVNAQTGEMTRQKKFYDFLFSGVEE